MQKGSQKVHENDDGDDGDDDDYGKGEKNISKWSNVSTLEVRWYVFRDDDNDKALFPRQRLHRIRYV